MQSIKYCTVRQSYKHTRLVGEAKFLRALCISPLKRLAEYY
jgi:hypothetical protein